MTTTLSQVLGEFVSSSRPEHLGASSLARAREVIADCIACALAGSITEVGRITREVAAMSYAQGEASVIGAGMLLNAQGAAFVNGTAGHALDYDDINWTLYGHPSVAILPAALAVAQTVGATGAQLAHAYVLGLEVAAKLGRWANPRHYEHGWHATGTIGLFGATAAAAALYRMKAEQVTMALGLAASQACGVRRNFGTMTKPFHAGNAARAGVLAAELARAGMTSDVRALEGAFGWFSVLQAAAVPNSSDLLSILGRPWDIDAPGVVIKRYPACGATHCALDALLALKEETHFGPDDVASIECGAHPLAKKVLLYPSPETGLEGKFSMEYCLATATVAGHPGLRHFEQPWVNDARVRALLPRISFRDQADLAVEPSADGVPARVTVRLNSGRRLEKTVRVPAGDPRNPMTAEDRRLKFLDCSQQVLEPAAADHAWDVLESLEGMQSVRALTQALGPAAHVD